MRGALAGSSANPTSPRRWTIAREVCAGLTRRAGRCTPRTPSCPGPRTTCSRCGTPPPWCASTGRRSRVGAAGPARPGRGDGAGRAVVGHHPLPAQDARLVRRGVRRRRGRLLEPRLARRRRRVHRRRPAARQRDRGRHGPARARGLGAVGADRPPGCTSWSGPLRGKVLASDCCRGRSLSVEVGPGIRMTLWSASAFARSPLTLSDPRITAVTGLRCPGTSLRNCGPPSTSVASRSPSRHARRARCPWTVTDDRSLPPSVGPRPGSRPCMSVLGRLLGSRKSGSRVKTWSSTTSRKPPRITRSRWASLTPLMARRPPRGRPRPGPRPRRAGRAPGRRRPPAGRAARPPRPRVARRAAGSRR